MAVGAIEPVFYARLLDGLGLSPEEVGAEQLDATTWPRVATLFESRFVTRTREYWTATFAAVDACVAPVLSVVEARSDPHLSARGVYAAASPAATPVGGAGPVQPAAAPRFSVTTTSAGEPAEAPGRHTEEVLAELGLA